MWVINWANLWSNQLNRSQLLRLWSLHRANPNIVTNRESPAKWSLYNHLKLNFSAFHRLRERRSCHIMKRSRFLLQLRKATDFSDLKITKITAYQVDLPLHEGDHWESCHWCGCHSTSVTIHLVYVCLVCSSVQSSNLDPSLFCHTYHISLHFVGSYTWAGGKSVSAFDATVVRVETNHGTYRAASTSIHFLHFRRLHRMVLFMSATK